MNYLNEEKLYRLISKVEDSMFYGGILPSKLKGDEILALHDALMLLQQLVKLGIIKFDDEGIVIKSQEDKNRTE